MLVPQNGPELPLFQTTWTFWATIEMSGMFRLVVEPLLEAMLMPFCQPGMLKFRLIPPPPPLVPSLLFQADSDTYAPPALLVIKLVPPARVMFVLSAYCGMPE